MDLLIDPVKKLFQLCIKESEASDLLEQIGLKLIEMTDQEKRL